MTLTLASTIGIFICILIVIYIAIRNNHKLQNELHYTRAKLDTHIDTYKNVVSLPVFYITKTDTKQNIINRTLVPHTYYLDDGITHIDYVCIFNSKLCKQTLIDGDEKQMVADLTKVLDNTRSITLYDVHVSHSLYEVPEPIARRWKNDIETL